MKVFLGGIVAGLAIAFLAIQFYRPARTNPRIDPKNTIEATMHVPPAVNAILERSCNDCHSNKTVWPWYSHVAPASWFLVDHVREGRDELSFSEWGTYSDRRKGRTFEEICGEVKNGAMPLKSYLLLHPDARLSAADVDALCTWSRSFAPMSASRPAVP